MAQIHERLGIIEDRLNSLIDSDIERKTQELVSERMAVSTFDERRITWSKLAGMTALEINNNWDDVQSFLTQQQGKKNYE